MGVGLNTMLAAVGAGGVATSKVSQAIGSQISEANDAEKNEMMAQRAKTNAEQLRNLRLKNKRLRMQNKALKDKQILKKEEKPHE